MKYKFVAVALFAALSAKAEKLDALEKSFKEASAEGAEMTADSIMELLTNSKADDAAATALKEAQEKLAAAEQANTELQAKLTAAENTATELTTQVENLRKGAGAAGAAAVATQETTAVETDSITAALAGKQGGELLAAMRENGLVR